MCFFFKQKTAYEMRISDWSSDVCSSDLPPQIEMRQQQQRVLYSLTVEFIRRLRRRFLFFPHWYRVMPLGAGACRRLLRSAVVPVIRPARPIPQQIRERSEEHTSELQSLMRISYAVFCLQKNIRKL